MRIAILTSPFFHDVKEITRMVDGKAIKGKDKIIFGGGERYLIDLCQLLQEDGHTVTVYQPFFGINTPFTKVYKGIPFVMIPNNGGSWEYSTCTDLNWQFNEFSALDDLRIYFTTFLAWPHAISSALPFLTAYIGTLFKATALSITLTMNSEKNSLNGNYTVLQPRCSVSVDSNVRKVIQATQPGAEKRIQIIYNYVDTKKFTPAKKKDWKVLMFYSPPSYGT